MEPSDRIKAQDVMRTVMPCQSIDELDVCLKALRERITQLSPVECIGAVRCSYTASALSKEWPLLLKAVRQHMLTLRSEKEVGDMLRGLDTPYKRTIW